MLKKIFSKIVSSLPQIMALLFISAFAVYAAWTGPSSPPPQGNVAAPINVGNVAQTKEGGLWLNIGTENGAAVNGLIIDKGNVGIGTTNPEAKLDVVGNIKIADGTQGLGKVLTADSSGVGSWQASVAVPSGAVMFFNLTFCPSGWSELTAARGRYVVGMPSAGTLSGSVGTALTNLENRSVGQHSHNVNDPGHFHDRGTASYIGGASGSGVARGNTAGAYTGITIESSGSVPGTNAPYIQFLVCQKN